MAKKITPAEYEQWLAENRPDITVLEPYQGVATKIMHQCNKGHEPWSAVPRNIKAGARCPACSAKGRKITSEEYVQWVKEHRPDITVLGEYEGSDTKIAHKCQQGHEFETKPSTIKSGSGCQKCGRESQREAMMKWSDEELIQDALRFTRRNDWCEGSTGYQMAQKRGRKFFEKCVAHMGRKANAGKTPEQYERELIEDGRGFAVLEPYVNSKAPITHRCVHGHEWKAAPQKVTGAERTGCPYCSGRKSEITYDEWLEANRPGFKALEEFIGVDFNIMHQCPEGHEWSARPAMIKRGNGCPHCSGRIPQDYRQYLAENHPELELLEDYKSNHEAIKHRCGCGEEWMVRPSNIKTGNSTACPRCSTANHKNDVVYAWEWVKDGVGTEAIKIGLTGSHRGDTRIKRTAKVNGMDYRIVFLLKTGEQQAKAIEQQLLASGHELEMPEHVVEGRTEFRYFHPDSRAMETINQLKAIAEGKPIQTQKLVARQ